MFPLKELDTCHTGWSISINPNANWYRVNGHAVIRETVFSVHEAEISGFGIRTEDIEDGGIL